jgi:hypothetical protein
LRPSPACPESYRPKIHYWQKISLFAQKRHRFLHKNACSESYTAEKTILYVSHLMYSALHSVHDQTILFTRPEDHGECSCPRQNDCPTVQTTASETYRVQTKIAKEQTRIGPTSNAIGPVVWAGSVPTNGKPRHLTLLRQNKVHSWIAYSVLGLDFLDRSIWKK